MRHSNAAWSSGRTLPFEETVDVAIASAARLTKAIPDVHPAGAAPRAHVPPIALRVRTLGALEVERDGVLLPDSAWKYARPRELFVYLLVHPEGRTREQIAAAFWPEASPAQAKNSFHVMLHHLRRALGRADLVVFADDLYQVNLALGVEVDVVAFHVRSWRRRGRCARIADRRRLPSAFAMRSTFIAVSFSPARAPATGISSCAIISNTSGSMDSPR